MNVVALIGRLAEDPELRHTQNDTAVTSFAVAVDRGYSKGSERQTDFITVVAWKQTAEFICKYFSKGKMISVTGSIQVRKYEDKNGNKRQAVEVVAREVGFCEGRKKEEPEEPVKQTLPRPAEPVESYEQAMLPPDDFLGDDDLPFD